MKVCHLTLCVLLMWTLTGCWDQIELEEQAYVVGIGLDKSEKQGTVKVTLQIANPEVGSAAKGSQTTEAPQEIVTFTSTDFISARHTANAFVTRSITFQLVSVIVVSEELAREEDFYQFLFATAKDKSIRRDVNLIVTSEKAEDFIRSVQSTLETRPHKFYQFMMDRGIVTGLIPKATIHRFLFTTEGDADLFLSMHATTKTADGKQGYEDEYLAGQIEQKGGSPSQFIGSGVFKEGKLIGYLNGEETRLSLLLDPTVKIKEIIATFKDPLSEQYRITVRIILSEKPTLDMQLKKEPAQIHAEIPIGIEILNIPSMVDYACNMKNQTLLKASIEDELNQKFAALIRKTQTTLKGEPFHWSLHARKAYLTQAAYQKADWFKMYPNMQIDIQTKVSINRFGKQIKLPSQDHIKD
ncbi:Ger(x)C family spore germination protein [Marinicrinis sediminis]|uniref:Ger(X)C family spore germination protein n=1 Tax=Marinicrinis sediminis TaxID=1652465 RepID=A0ABW5REF8_9BACL